MLERLLAGCNNALVGLNVVEWRFGVGQTPRRLGAGGTKRVGLQGGEVGDVAAFERKLRQGCRYGYEGASDESPGGESGSGETSGRIGAFAD